MNRVVYTKLATQKQISTSALQVVQGQFCKGKVQWAISFSLDKIPLSKNLKVVYILAK